MLPGAKFIIEDEGDNQFKQFSLLKDTDISYEIPDKIQSRLQGDDNDERIDLYRRRKETFR